MRFVSHHAETLGCGWMDVCTTRERLNGLVVREKNRFSGKTSESVLGQLLYSSVADNWLALRDFAGLCCTLG